MKPTYIWGAGHYGVLTALDCERRGIEIAGFIDSNASKIKTRLGLPCLSLEQVPLPTEPLIIAIQNEEAVRAITEKLKSQGIDFEISNSALQTNSQANSLQILNDIYKSQGFFNAVQNCEWLNFKEFYPGGWAMDYTALHTLFRILQSMKPGTILEFGLGESSKLVHQYAIFYDRKAVTVEHDLQWISFFKNSISGQFDVKIKQLDLEMAELNGYETKTYSRISNSFAGEKFELFVVDGPYGSAHVSRSQILQFIPNGITDSFCIFMDDADRQGEKETLGLICDKLSKNGIKYVQAQYFGVKGCAVICSEDLKFLCSLS